VSEGDTLSHVLICFVVTRGKYIQLSLLISVERAIKNGGLVDVFVLFSLMAVSTELLEVVNVKF
jgi:hypothetical protein